MATEQAHPDRGRGPADSAGPPDAIDRYRQIYEAVALPVLMLDAETWRIVAANDAALRQYGYTREEFLGLSVLSVRPPEGRDDARQVLTEMPRGSWRTSAVRHQRKDGSVFSADVWARDTIIDGRPVRVCTISDVTERVELQHELQQAQKMEAVGQLAGGIAHEFNNALTSIIASAELLMEERESDAPAPELGTIRRSAERAASLTRELLAFSRRQVLQAEATTLTDVARRLEPLVRSLADDRVELHMELAEDAWPVRVDPTQIEHVVLNLASNARDAMPSGGTLTLSTHNTSLAADEPGRGRVIPSGAYAELRVRDTGIGMDAMTRTRIFEPFFTTKPPPRGTGLGLSTSYGIIRQMGGFVTVDSSPGYGTSFHVLLPRIGSEGRTATGAEAEARGTVLVVEDEDAVRHLTRQVLERLGFSVLDAEDGTSALAMIESGLPPIDLLVTDLAMPNVSGRDVAERLKAINPDLPVILVPGYADDAAGQSGVLEHGMVFLQKPFSIESLGDAVRRVMEDA